MKCGVTSKGYKTITPALDGKYKTQLVHRIVCESFYGRPPNGMTQVRHLNGNQKDNAPENLDWGTQEQNWRDRAAHGRGMGEDHHSSKLTHEDVKKIRCSDISQRNLAKIFNVSQSTIQSILSNDTWDLSKNVAPVNMPRSASRITLEITCVRVERLQDISEEDAKAEGVVTDGEYSDRSSEGEENIVPCLNCRGTGLYTAFTGGGANPDQDCPYCDTMVKRFALLWDYLAKPGAKWSDNPWVWVIEFRRVEK